jgi:serine phosphatase RsbU (regulator of sigma subunit)
MKNKINSILNDRYLCIIAASFVLIILGFIDWWTGYELSFQFFYFIPLTIFSYNTKFNKASIVLFAFITSLVWFLADYFADHVYSDLFLYFWNTMSRLIVFCTFSLFLNSIIKHRSKIDLLNSELLNKELLVTDSIKYAKTIQDSIIPSFNGFNKLFPDSFILSKPKAILSGDFFWYYRFGEKTFFAVVDCTGHGIPGSLLSVIGNILVHRIIIDNGETIPNKILENLHKELVHVFSAGNEPIDDGMEISLVLYDESKSEICISQTSQGALLVKPDGSVKLFEPNGFTVGGMLSKIKGASYTSETMKIEKGSRLYLFTDGYIDQFGLKENIKFGINNFIELIENVHSISSTEQKNVLIDTIEKWMGDSKQIDDITVVGVKF